MLSPFTVILCFSLSTATIDPIFPLSGPLRMATRSPLARFQYFTRSFFGTSGPESKLLFNVPYVRVLSPTSRRGARLPSCHSSCCWRRASLISCFLALCAGSRSLSFTFFSVHFFKSSAFRALRSASFWTYVVRLNTFCIASELRDDFAQIKEGQALRVKSVQALCVIRVGLLVTLKIFTRTQPWVSEVRHSMPRAKELSTFFVDPLQPYLSFDHINFINIRSSVARVYLSILSSTQNKIKCISCHLGRYAFPKCEMLLLRCQNWSAKQCNQ